MNFAKIYLKDQWVKVMLLRRNPSSLDFHWVRRLDGSGRLFKVKTDNLARWGLHDNESPQQIEDREEYEKVEKLLAEKGFLIERVTKDGNCLYRAAARKIYGDAERYQQVRDETVDYIISEKSHFSAFDTDIDRRLSEQLLKRTWGGHLEIAAMSELYIVHIKVWELSSSGELAAPFDNTNLATSKVLECLYLVRHRRIH